MEFILPQSLLQSWQEFARPFIHPEDAIDQRAIVLIERDKGLTLVRDAKRLQPPAIYLTYRLSNRVSHGTPPGFSRLLMPGRLGSQQGQRAISTGNRSAATIPHDRFAGCCTAIATQDQRGRVFHLLPSRKPKAFQVKQPLWIKLLYHRLVACTFEDQIYGPHSVWLLYRAAYGGPFLPATGRWNLANADQLSVGLVKMDFDPTTVSQAAGAGLEAVHV